MFSLVQEPEMTETSLSTQMAPTDGNAVLMQGKIPASANYDARECGHEVLNIGRLPLEMLKIKIDPIMYMKTKASRHNV
jgi:hypothetical protein